MHVNNLFSSCIEGQLSDRALLLVVNFGEKSEESTNFGSCLAQSWASILRHI